MSSSGFPSVSTTHLPVASASFMEILMITRPTVSLSARAAFAGATVRALTSSLLLLGLIGDRRVR